MAELSYPTSGGGSVTDAKYEQLIGKYGPSGLLGDFDAALPLVYADSTGRQVKVRGSRAAIVRGFRWETDSAGLTVPIAANASGQPRHDRAVLRLDRSNWTVTFQVIQGQPSATPADPDYTVQDGPSGVWELRLARIVVANGAVTIAPGNVINQAFHIGGFTTRGEKGWPPSPAGNGHLFYAYDNARLYAAVNDSYRIVAEAGTQVAVAGASGWDTKWVYCTRWNGFVYFHALPVRTGGNLAAGTDSTICTIPTAYRPPDDIFLLAFHGNQILRCHIAAATGVFRVLDYGINLVTGAGVSVHPATWPANNS